MHSCYNEGTEAERLFQKQEQETMVQKQQEAIQQGEILSSDEVAFCSLIARILMRCLKENNPEVLKQLSLLQQEQQNTGESDVSAA